MTEDRYLVIHCDDIGMSFGANEASKKLLKKGIARSGSIMVPCPWAFGFVNWLRVNPNLDVGIHVTLNSEWDTYRWGPVAGRSVVPGLCDGNGFLHANGDGTMLAGTGGEVFSEIRAQIELGMKWGLRPTHLDIHMGTTDFKAEYSKAYYDLAYEFRILPLLVGSYESIRHRLERQKGAAAIESLNRLEKCGVPVFDRVMGARSGASYEESMALVHRQIQELKPGLNYLIIHPNEPTPDTRHIMDFSEDRDWNFRIFMEDQTEEVIRQSGVQVITWRELKEKLALRWQ